MIDLISHLGCAETGLHQFMQRFHFIDKETESQKIQGLDLASHYAKE